MDTQPSRASITVGGIRDFACGEPIDTQDRALLALLPGVAAIQLTTEGFDALAPGIVDSDIAGPLHAHYLANPGLTRLVLRDASGEATAIYAPGAGSNAIPTPTPRPSAPVFAEGDHDLVGTHWVLVGWSDAGIYRAADLAAGADLVLSNTNGTRRFVLGTGCLELDGEWSREAAQPGSPTRRIDLQIFGRDEPPPCATEVQAQADAVVRLIDTAGAYTVGVQGPDSLAPGIAADDLDAELWAHFDAYPTLTRLVLRDQSGEATLIYAPVAVDA